MYAGAGGMSCGLNKHFDVKWVSFGDWFLVWWDWVNCSWYLILYPLLLILQVVDNDHLAAATLRANKTNKECKIYTEDAKTFLKQTVQGNPCYPTTGEPDHIHASPPCKGFSRANRNGGKDDLLNNKVGDYLLLSMILRFDIFIKLLTFLFHSFRSKLCCSSRQSNTFAPRPSAMKMFQDLFSQNIRGICNVS